MKSRVCLKYFVDDCRTFTSIVRDMSKKHKKQFGTSKIRSTQNNTKNNEHKSMKGDSFLDFRE